MAGDLLLDTGALVSLLDRSQEHHAACLAVLEGWDGRLVSTEGVLTESTHLLQGARNGSERCIEFFLAGGATLVPASAASLERCRDLMRRYADLPMDYADASLVALAEDLDTRLVFTIDRDFEVYRIDGRKRFELYPAIPRRRTKRSRKRVR